jgi:hypothetical protein
MAKGLASAGAKVRKFFRINYTHTHKLRAERNGVGRSSHKCSGGSARQETTQGAGSGDRHHSQRQ